MEVLLALIGLGLIGLVLLAAVLALVALSRSKRLEADLSEVRMGLGSLEARLNALGRRVVGERAPAPEAAPPSPPVVETRLAPPPVVAAPPRPQPPQRPPAPLKQATPPPETADFATSLGPKILVATGALACVVFLALFVKYAWENNWVGPAGRVLLGAAASVTSIAAGLRLLGRDYRPLGQGLAGLGFAGLYVSAFGAHGFYDLIPRAAAGALMVAVTASAVALAARLDTRLLADLAWVGGYLTPILLATGQDRALSLYLYLAVLGIGALVLDRRKPWPETLPLAFLGTVLLYGGWYARFFGPERFEVAAFGVVLFTALFAFGAAHKERGPELAVVLGTAALGLTTLAAGANRPAILIVLSLGLAAAALRLAARFGLGFGAVAALAAGLPFLGWTAGHYRPQDFGIAAAWVVGGMLLFLWPLAPGGVAAAVFPATAQAAGGLAAIALAAGTDEPLGLLALLVAQAGIAFVLRSRWPFSEFVGMGSALLAVLVWVESHYEAARSGQTLLLALGLGGLYLLALVVGGLVRRQELGAAGVLTHLANAALAWTVLFRVLYETNPTALGLASVALATLYLALGLFALRGGVEALQTRTLLGLAAAFLTVAIPVQLGLHGITLAWAVEGVLLLWLGLRSQSVLARLGGYGVLGFAVLRLLFRHLPLHDGPFRPVLNPAFGTWLFVIVAVGVAVLLARRAHEEGEALDRMLRHGLAVLALSLLFGVATAETRASFRQLGGEAALRMGGVALSILWTVFAMGLLAAGLGLRNRALFYSAYGLFAFTAAKVLLVDLSTFPAPYRMLSFLALGVLLLAGAFLNLRFRERLRPRESRP